MSMSQPGLYREKLKRKEETEEVHYLQNYTPSCQYELYRAIFDGNIQSTYVSFIPIHKCGYLLNNWCS